MSSLDLHRHQVKLSRHSTKWLALGEQAVAELIALCRQPALHVEHVGSTSVADLDAKRILDLLVGLEDVCRFDNLRSHWFLHTISIGALSTVVLDICLFGNRRQTCALSMPTWFCIPQPTGMNTSVSGIC